MKGLIYYIYVVTLWLLLIQVYILKRWNCSCCSCCIRDSYNNKKDNSIFFDWLIWRATSSYRAGVWRSRVPIMSFYCLNFLFKFSCVQQKTRRPEKDQKKSRIISELQRKQSELPQSELPQSELPPQQYTRVSE